MIVVPARAIGSSLTLNSRQPQVQSYPPNRRLVTSSLIHAFQPASLVPHPASLDFCVCAGTNVCCIRACTHWGGGGHTSAHARGLHVTHHTQTHTHALRGGTASVTHTWTLSHTHAHTHGITRAHTALSDRLAQTNSRHTRTHTQRHTHTHTETSAR